MYLVGQLDDLREVSAPAKTAGSVLAGSILAVSGVAILFFRVPFVGPGGPAARPVPLITVLWVVGMAQAVNLIDGLDGLAAGVVGIAAGRDPDVRRVPRQRRLDHHRRQHRGR